MRNRLHLKQKTTQVNNAQKHQKSDRSEIKRTEVSNDVIGVSKDLFIEKIENAVDVVNGNSKGSPCVVEIESEENKICVEETITKADHNNGDNALEEGEIDDHDIDTNTINVNGETLDIKNETMHEVRESTATKSIEITHQKQSILKQDDSIEEHSFPINDCTFNEQILPTNNSKIIATHSANTHTQFNSNNESDNLLLKSIARVDKNVISNENINLTGPIENGSINELNDVLNTSNNKSIKNISTSLKDYLIVENENNETTIYVTRKKKKKKDKSKNQKPENSVK